MSAPRAQIGPYKVDRELGRGGMGEVYLGRDTRLDRPVAIKALPAHLAQDPGRLARFQREAKVLASLNHPGIGAIYGLEEDAGHQFLILEFVEGETLADQLKRGAIPIDKALRLANTAQGAPFYRPGQGGAERALALLDAGGKLEPWSTERRAIELPPAA